MLIQKVDTFVSTDKNHNKPITKLYHVWQIKKKKMLVIKQLHFLLLLTLNYFCQMKNYHFAVYLNFRIN